jgi:hypothetical protein
MSQLKAIMRHAEQLHDLLEPDTDLPEWVQSKITLAYDYIQTAADYMATELDEEMSPRKAHIVSFGDRHDARLKAAAKYKANLLMSKYIPLSLLEPYVTEDDVLAAIETGYKVMKRTGDVNKAAETMQAQLNAIHKKNYEKKTKLPWPANDDGRPVALGRRFMSGSKKKPNPNDKIPTNDNARSKPKLAEATYKGKTVKLNKPMAGDVKKSKVFVDPDGDGKAQKVNFGDKNLSIKKHIPDRKKSYCARSSGQGNLTDKTSANYWSRKAWDC